MRAGAVWLVDAVNSVVSHGLPPFKKDDPSEAAGSLIFGKGPARFVVFKTRLAGLRPPGLGKPAVSAAGFPAMPLSGPGRAPSAASSWQRRPERPETATPL